MGGVCVTVCVCVCVCVCVEDCGSDGKGMDGSEMVKVIGPITGTTNGMVRSAMSLRVCVCVCVCV